MSLFVLFTIGITSDNISIMVEIRMSYIIFYIL